jgi:shikimate kinase
MSEEAPPPTRIVLVGFMGAGKTSVGRKLATRLGWAFVDLDRRIEEQAGTSVPQLFRERGEPAFRELEQQAAESLADARDTVVAAGGGAFQSPATRAALSRGALTVWLRCDLETLLRRIGRGAGRPLAGSRETMRALLEQREATYKLADRAEDTARASPSEVARRVAQVVTGAGQRTD